MVPESYQGGEEFADDSRVDMVDVFPYRVGDPIGALSGGAGALGEGEPNLFFGEGGGGGVPCWRPLLSRGSLGGKSDSRVRC